MNRSLIVCLLAICVALLSGCAGGGAAMGNYKVTAYKPKNPSKVRVTVYTSTQHN